MIVDQNIIFAQSLETANPVSKVAFQNYHLTREVWYTHIYFDIVEKYPKAELVYFLDSEKIQMQFNRAVNYVMRCSIKLQFVVMG